nr:putative uncharacterized protein [uncultured bacterium]
MRKALCAALSVIALTLIGCGEKNGTEGREVGQPSRLFKGSSKAPASKDSVIDLAFVLLPEAQLPDAAGIVSAYGEFAVQGETIGEIVEEGNTSETTEVLLFDLGCEQPALVAFVPAAVPNGEAEQGAEFSLASLGTDWALEEHQAHLVVAGPSCDSLPRVDALSRFTSFLAAVTRSSKAVGVSWGNAGATHSAEFFTSVASEVGVVPRITLWSGISVAREADGRLSLLSHGMQQLKLPELLLVVSPSSESRALEIFFDLLAYVAERGEAIPDGDTVGRSEAEKLPVKYVRSPVDPSVKVWRVEIP